MALDEPKEDDEVVQSNGFKLVVNKALAEQSGGVAIDYLTGPFRKGFQIKSAAPSDSACGSGCSC